MSHLAEAPRARLTDRTDTRIVPPSLEQGADLWRLAAASDELDLNSSYMYLLLARDFAATSRIALVDGKAAGFVIGYRRPDESACLFIWQVAVGEAHRGRGLASCLLDDLIRSAQRADVPMRHLETTITDDNGPSQRLFAGLAARWGASHDIRPLLDGTHFPDDHAAERLHRIGPFTT